MPPPVPPLPPVVVLAAPVVVVAPVVVAAVDVDAPPSVELVALVDVGTPSFAGGEENTHAVSRPEAIRASDQVAAEGAYSLITKP